MGANTLRHNQYLIVWSPLTYIVRMKFGNAHLNDYVIAHVNDYVIIHVNEYVIIYVNNYVSATSIAT